MKRLNALIKSNKIIKRVFDYLMITIAAFIYGMAISLFLDPNDLAMLMQQ